MRNGFSDTYEHVLLPCLNASTVSQWTSLFPILGNISGNDRSAHYSNIHEHVAYTESYSQRRHAYITL